MDFLDVDILEDEKGVALKGIELIPLIRSITIIIDELLSAIDTLDCLSIERKINKKEMQKAFNNSKVHNNVDLDGYEE